LANVNLEPPKVDHTKICEEDTIHVLHVDDEVGLQKCTKQILELQESFQVDSASSVKEALERMKEKEFDVIVSDYQMPIKDGLEFLKELRDNGNSIPFILFTGRGREEVAIKALNLGADRYLSKIGKPETVYGELAHTISLVAEKQRSELMLEESEKRFKLYVESSPVAVFVANPEGKYEYVNEAASRLLGFSKEELLEMSILQVAFKQDNPIDQDRFVEVKKTGRSLSEIALKTKDGLPVYVILNSVKLPDGNLMGFCENITERKDVEQKLQLSEAHLKKSQSITHISHWEWNVQTGALVWGEEHYRIFGLPPETVPSMDNFLCMVHPDDVALVKQSIEDALKGKPYHIDFRIIRPDGVERALNGIGEVKFDAEGKPTRMFGTVQDVTERKKADESLKKAEKYYRTVFENTGTAMCILEEDMTISMVNNQFETVSGYSWTELKGKKWTEFVTKNYLEQMKRYHEARRKKGLKPPTHYNFDFVNKKGQIRNCLLTIKLIPETKKSVASVLDITEQKKTEKLLQDAEEQYRKTIVNANVGIICYSPDGEVKIINPKMEQMIGFKRTEIPTLRDWFKKLYPNEEERYKIRDKWFKRMKEEGEIKEGHAIITTKDGKRRNFLFNGVQLDSGGSIAFAEDITERKKMEQELMKSEEKYRRQFEEALDATFLADAETGILVDCNRAATKLVGRKKSEIIGKPQLILHPPEETEGEFSRTFKRHLKEKEGKVLETQVITKNGEIREVAIKANFFEVRNKRLLQGIFRDITERKKAENALRESAEKYRDLINAMNDTVWVIDFDAKFIDVNDAAVRVLGYSREELLSMGPTDIDDTLPSEEIKALIKGMKTDEIQVFETAHTTKDGKKIPVEISSSRVTYNGKQAILSIARDITERKQAEEKLHASEERFRHLVENAPEAIYVNDIEGIFIAGNKHTEELTGYKREELIGKNMLEVNLFPEKYFPKIIEGLKANIRGEKTGPDELELIKKDGSIIVIENVSIPVKREGKIEVMGVARDITERKRLVRALQERDERFRQVAENAVEWIWEVDADGLYTYSSPAVEKLLGYKPEELVGKKHFYDMFHPDEQENLKKIAFSAFKEKQSFHEFVNRNVDKNGSAVWLSTSGVPIVDDEGKLVGYQGADVDITDRKKAEDAVVIMVNELEKVIEKLGVVGKAARHDARNKLSIVLNNAYLIKQRLTGDKKNLEYLGAIESAVEQIEKIFAFAKTYEMIGIEERTDIDVEKSVKEAAELYSVLGGMKLENESRGLTVLADSQLRQLFYNLIDNSMKHGEKVTKIRVYYEEKDDQLKLIYEDDGVGIPEDEKELIFKEGYGKGTGYGLYLIQKICELYGWTIQETGTPGKGAQFTMTVPKTGKNGKTVYQLQ
jgi:PAS domain S-box-containing protein